MMWYLVAKFNTEAILLTVQDMIESGDYDIKDIHNEDN